ncbi:UDP-N-Acetylglucosamine 2-epimerase [Armatimonadetes bacterium GBS]|jgi:UDP-N-acetylglucosamine 2-epimerase (non-hydrolysing)|nr:UDP-N-acetylglucosamine 2-epimerase [bacterium HR14]GIV13936.1 MAG: UDP-N-acetyl glucosamine 2-epimerase [Fimbriimonadales bacterium]CUU08884.1 UDP-N-Acetylglucosamine 2-epimerase [Armatimonadetes bacterium GBS]CUU34932.1 UDP-N-Acetylglucosamine 2-epimerase [Armatimonadetes bacterium GXS]
MRHAPIRVMAVCGTRPDAIKMAPVVRTLREDPAFSVRLVATGQHREMLDQVLRLFALTPDEDLNIMTPHQTLTEITLRTLEGLDRVMRAHPVDVVLAQGDTTTTFVAALCAFYHKTPFGHVEAGLRTYDLYHPFPEEMNRRLTAPIARFHFAPTERARQNLIQEHIPPEHIWVTGNTGIDAVLWVAQQPVVPRNPELQQALSHTGRVILLTTHRRENWGEPMRAIARAARKLLEQLDDLVLLAPMHRNPLVREALQSVLGDHPRALLTEPLDYDEFVHAMRKATLILTDSGGVQEEAPAFGKPILVLRHTTERPEGVEAGTAKLVGTETEVIYTESLRLLTDPEAYQQMAQAVNPYGDGKASQRIAQILKQAFG